MANQIYLEIAARCPVEILANERNGDKFGERDDSDVVYTVYRFDTRMIGGDYHIVKIPQPFAEPTHMAARAKLFEDVRGWFIKGGK